jgi:hypothetical protein
MPVVFITGRSWGGRGSDKATAVFPLIAVLEDGQGGDAVVPILERLAINRDVVKVSYVVVEEEAGAAKVVVGEDAQAGSAKDADGSDPVVESRGHGGPALTYLEAEEISAKIVVFVETGSGPGWVGASPLPLGKCGQRGEE